MPLTVDLVKFGLTPNEAKIYLSLLEFGHASPPQIAKATGIARTNTYNILTRLKQLEIIDVQIKNGKKVYIMLEPSTLNRILEKKKNQLDSLLPDLKTLFKKSSNKPIVKFFEGLEMVKSLYQEVLETDELYAIGSTKKMMEIDEKFFIHFERQVKDQGIVVHEIIPSSSKEQGYPQSKAILKGLLESIHLGKEYPDTNSDILVWNDNIAIINLKEPIFGTKISHAGLADTFRTLFRVISDSHYMA